MVINIIPPVWFILGKFLIDVSAWLRLFPTIDRQRTLENGKRGDSKLRKENYN